MTFLEVQDYIEKNYNLPEVLAIRKKWGLEREITFDDARRFMSEHASDSNVAEYRLNLSKVNELNLMSDLAANYEKVKANPFRKETFNLTMQGNLYRSDPIMYNALRQAAGYKTT